MMVFPVLRLINLCKRIFFPIILAPQSLQAAPGITGTGRAERIMIINKANVKKQFLITDRQSQVIWEEAQK